MLANATQIAETTATTITVTIPLILTLALIAYFVKQATSPDYDTEPLTPEQQEEIDDEYNPEHTYTWTEYEIWICAYCNSENPLNQLKCHNCSAPRKRVNKRKNKKET